MSQVLLIYLFESVEWMDKRKRKGREGGRRRSGLITEHLVLLAHTDLSEPATWLHTGSWAAKCIVDEKHKDCL